MNNNIIKDEYINEANSKVFTGDRWRDYFIKKISDAMKTNDGLLIAFEKPHIKTHYCFGYGYCGVTNSEEMKEASDRERYARENAAYFLRQNTKDIKDNIYFIESYLLYKNGHYEQARAFYEKYTNNYNDFLRDAFIIKQYPDYKTCLASIKFIDRGRDYEIQKEWIIREATQQEVRAYLFMLKNELEKLNKRLNTYLKRFGLSKLHTWTYLID